MKNTALVYMYRDASNYKFTYRVVFAGTIESVADALENSNLEQIEHQTWSFKPDNVGLPHPLDFAEADYDEALDDHPWCEISPQDFRPVNNPTTDLRTIDEFIEELTKGEPDE